MPIILTERFARAYAKLPGDVQKKVDKALRLLDEDLRHPSLRARRMEGRRESTRRGLIADTE